MLPPPNTETSTPKSYCAFPVVPNYELWRAGYNVDTGLSERQWFAGQALQGCVEAVAAGRLTAEQAVFFAFAVADQAVANKL